MGLSEDKRTPSAETVPLSAEILAHSLRKVRATYHEYNHSLFGGRLRAPSLEWTESESEWGAWVGGQRVLRLSLHLLTRPWGQLLEVLKHEMAHQYVEEVEGIGAGEGPHGATFRRVCRERGIDEGATGDPTANPLQTEPQHHAILRRIGHLLALAESENQHEAETAMATARRLMLKYNLEEAASAGASEYSFRHLGKPTGRRMAWQRVLANILTEYFFVEVIIVPMYRPIEQKNGSVLEAIGTRHNLDMAAYAHDFLERAAHSLWGRHKREHGLGSDRDKQSFLYGVLSGFSKKLERTSLENQKEGLVWLGDPELGRYFRARHPHIRSVSGRARVASEAFSAGHQAGERIVLHRGVEAGSTGAVPRLLGARKPS